MKKLLIGALNEVYGPLGDRTGALKALLDKRGYAVKSGWYPLHSTGYAGGYLTERFPIPVLSVGGVCDVGIDIDEVFVEGKLDREQAARLDANQLSGLYIHTNPAPKRTHEPDLFAHRRVVFRSK